MADFELFKRLSLLYFAAASFSAGLLERSGFTPRPGQAVATRT